MWNGKNNYIIYINNYEKVNCFYTELKYFWEIVKCKK